ncbi:MAG: hypothetical protein OEO19_04675 [Gammaproteobacteria bacterium]|nr:hypothetical protein [Gammaproteobacteria bacterium]MDH3446786.1 hypothetical protein [Gammaproteobacteria bacterium]
MPIDNAEMPVTMDGECREIGNGAILIRDHVIGRIGSSSGGIRAGIAASGPEPERYIDAGGGVILLTCAPASAWLSLINGRIVIEQGHIVGVDLDSLVQQHNQQARLLQRAASKGHYHD